MSAVILFFSFESLKCESPPSSTEKNDLHPLKDFFVSKFQYGLNMRTNQCALSQYEPIKVPDVLVKSEGFSSIDIEIRPLSRQSDGFVSSNLRRLFQLCSAFIASWFVFSLLAAAAGANTGSLRLHMD